MNQRAARARDRGVGSVGAEENFGTMVKPLHAGLAARNGILAQWRVAA